MKFEIKSRWDSKILFTAEAASLLLALEAAIKAGINLSGADLSGADLSEADLSGADLSGADLSKAYLYKADLSKANLSGADLSGADLSEADLSGADLSEADLSKAYLYKADLSGADLSGAKNSELVQAQTSILPEGNLVGWKMCRNNVVVKVLIPQKARRSNATGRKCRAEYVQVLQVFGAEEGISRHDGKTAYRKGEIVKCNNWDENRWAESSGGIHFFLTRIEAESY